MFVTRRVLSSASRSLVRRVRFSVSSQPLTITRSVAAAVKPTTHHSGLRYAAIHTCSAVLNADAQASGGGGGGSESHSQSQSQRAASEEAFREKILEAALTRVADHGWTDNALRAGAESLGYPPTLHGLFPRGAFDLVDFWMAKSADKSIELLQAMPLSQWSTTDKLKAAVRTRLEVGVIPVVSNWSQAMAVGAQPQNLPHTIARISDFVDRVWFIAGDTSTDVNWYIKRSLLLGVYTTTELYLLTDRSNGYADTWQFLQRRLDDSQCLAALPTQIESVAGNVLNFVWNNINPPAKYPNQHQQHTASPFAAAAAADAPNKS